MFFLMLFGLFYLAGVVVLLSGIANAPVETPGTAALAKVPKRKSPVRQLHAVHIMRPRWHPV